MENEPSFEMLERNRLRLKFNFESICKKYEKVDDSLAVEIDPLTNEFYYRAGTQRKDVRKQQERFYAANENFGFSAISAPFNIPENLDNQPKLVKACQRKNAKFSEILALTPWHENNVKKEEPETSEMKVAVRQTNKEFTSTGVSVNKLESMIRREGIQGKIISRSVVDGVAKIVVMEPETVVRVKREVRDEDAAGPSGNDAYMKKIEKRYGHSIKKERADQTDVQSFHRFPQLKIEPKDGCYDDIDIVFDKFEGSRQSFLVKKKSVDDGSGFLQNSSCNPKIALISVKKEPVDDDVMVLTERKYDEMQNPQSLSTAPFGGSPDIPQKKCTDEDEDVPSETSDFSCKSGFPSAKAPLRPMSGIEEEEALEDEATSERSGPRLRGEDGGESGENEKKETAKEKEELWPIFFTGSSSSAKQKDQKESDPAVIDLDDGFGENEESSPGPSSLQKLPLLGGVRKRRSSVQVFTPKSKKSRDSDWGSVEVPRSCSGNESPAEMDENAVDGLWTGSADSIVNSFRSENGQTVVGLQISAATKMCADSPDRPLLELWADYAADVAKEEGAGEFDYVAKEERRNANRAKRRNNHMQNGYKK